MTEVLLTGLKIAESARWHDGRLWLSNWGAQQVLAVGSDGKAEVMATVPTTIPFSIDWRPDGRLLVVAGPEGRLLRQEPDGSLVDHADLTVLDINLNELVVDGRGNIYVNGGTDFHPGAGEAPGFVAPGHAGRPGPAGRRGARVPQRDGRHPRRGDPDRLGVVRGHAHRPSTSAPTGACPTGGCGRRCPGDGIVLDTEGAVWTPGWNEDGPACLRVAEGGEVLATVPLDRAGFACTLGGEDGRPCSCLPRTAHGRRLRGQTQAPDHRARRRPVLIAHASAAHAANLNDRHSRARLAGPRGQKEGGARTADPGVS